MKKSILMLALTLSLSAGAAEKVTETVLPEKADKAGATSLQKDFDSLGGNEALLEKAKDLNPETSIGVVQKRAVDRTNRIELDLLLGLVAGGDPYVNTKNIGGTINYHFIPRISAGLRYVNSYNELTSEANRQIYQEGSVPDVDHAKSTILGLVNFYPVYGKTNFFDLGIQHFDLYVLGGYGRVDLKSGSAPTFTYGAGIGLWITQHISARFELRSQQYQIKTYDGTRDLNLTMADFSLGYLL